jgi:hypothetical protein
LRRPVCRVEDNKPTTINLKATGCESGLDSAGSGLCQVVSCCEHGNEPSDDVTEGDLLFS